MSELDSQCEAAMSPLLKLAHKFNRFYLSGNTPNNPCFSEFLRQMLSCGLNGGECKPFIVEGFQVGMIRPDVMKQLLKFPEVFRITTGFVELNPAFRDYNERTDQVNKLLMELRDQKAFITLKGWRDECYEVRPEFHQTSLFKMDRCATCLFGIRNYGVDINGYVNHPKLGLCIWLQQRSATKQTWPGKWDTMVAGGLSVGHTIIETAHKEAMEEASVPTDLMKKLQSAGVVSFFFESERGLFPNTEFVFDLELPLDFIPKNADGEVQKFELLPAKQCLDRLFSEDFKTTSVPVTLDFLIRHGIISPENEPHYARIVELLHVPLQKIYEGNKKNQENGDVNEINCKAGF